MQTAIQEKKENCRWISLVNTDAKIFSKNITKIRLYIKRLFIMNKTVSFQRFGDGLICLNR